MTYPGCMRDPEFHSRIKIEFDDMEREDSDRLTYYQDRSARTYFIARENRKRKKMSPACKLCGVEQFEGMKICATIFHFVGELYIYIYTYKIYIYICCLCCTHVEHSCKPYRRIYFGLLL